MNISRYDSSHTLYDFGPLARDYNKWYETPLGRSCDIAQKEAVSELLPPPRPGDWLLDVGCGTGHWSRFFAEKGYKVKGIDISPEMIATARASELPGGLFELGDACELPVDNFKYPVVAAIATLEFVNDQVAAVAGMVQNAAAGGTVLIGTLNGLASMNRERVKASEQPYASAQLLDPCGLHSLMKPYGEVKMIGASMSNEKTAAQSVTRIVKLRGSEVPNDILDMPFIVAAVNNDKT